MQQVVFVEEVSLVQVGTGRRPSTLPALLRIPTRFLRWGLVQLRQGLQRQLRLGSAGFQLAKRSAADLTIYPFCFQPYYVRLKTRKKIPKFRPWLM